jgi:hypothetical protein
VRVAALAPHAGHAVHQARAAGGAAGLLEWLRVSA